jgi:cytochrome P450
MSHDDNVYKDPDSFDPDRFSTGSVPIAPAFGWEDGECTPVLLVYKPYAYKVIETRIRKCPGMHFAEASLFLAITSLLATFRFSRKKNESGNEIVPTIKGAFNSLVV